MKYLFAFASIVLILLMFGCGTGKQLAQNRTTADTYYNTDNYNDALLAYTTVIEVYENNNNSAECSVYTKAGESALNIGDTKLAIDYLKKASNSNYIDESTYFYLAQAYGKINNLSLELMTLVDYLEKYQEGKEINAVNTRLFHIYVETDNYVKALGLWPDVRANNQQDAQLLELYFKANNGLDNTDTCNDIARQLLGLDSDNVVALTWFGKQYYRKAEDLYQKEMKAYDNHKTNKQYRILLKALDVVTADFKKSLNYFKKLYAIQPTPENANYLSHIYGRLGDKKKQAYYKDLANS